MTTKELPIRIVKHAAGGVRLGFALCVMFAVTACAPAPEPTRHTVEYYRANKEARDVRVAECANDPGALGKTPDCINAKQAAAIEDIGNLRDLPPMGLLKDGDEKPGQNHSSSGSSRPGNSQSTTH